MKFNIQLIIQSETGEKIQELAYLERENAGIEEIGIIVKITSPYLLLGCFEKGYMSTFLAIF